MEKTFDEKLTRLAQGRRDFLKESALAGKEWFDDHVAFGSYEDFRNSLRTPGLSHTWETVAGFPNGDPCSACALMEEYDEESFVRGFLGRVREVIRRVDYEIQWYHTDIDDQEVERRMNPEIKHGPVPRLSDIRKRVNGAALSDQF